MAPSRNGFAMTSKFWINGVYIATFVDDGNGGQPDWTDKNFADPRAADLYCKWVEGLEDLPAIYLQEYDHHMVIDQFFFIDMLHAALINNTEFKLLEAA